ncbi:MAG: MMPL family transporter [Roseiarcus sp.]|jgi:hopanoid biosynthesis associated RND transporter like protein HpnN
MLTSLIVRIIGFCVAHAWAVVMIGLLAAAGACYYAAGHFRLNSDVNAVLPNDLGWRKREQAFENAFRRFDLIEVVVEAPTPELTGAATAELTRALAEEKTQFQDVASIGGSEFFARHGLLFQSKEELERDLGGLVQGEPLIRDMATDRSLQGLIAGLEDALLGVQNGRLKLDDLARPLDEASATLEQSLAGRPASFSWRVLTQGGPAAPGDLRGFIEIRPRLDFRALQPGLEASDVVRRIAAGVAPKYQARVRLTGPVAMSDEQFGTIKENAVRNGIVTLAIVAVILWLALRSGRLIAAVTVNLIVGLALTAALGLMLVGAFNLISVYFAVLFVGIGLDFGIQYSVRYRSERHDLGDLRRAVEQAGFHVGAPLTLAAFATAAGFLSFLPTDYRGVSELGLIAGCGMLIAFATSVTLLPALIFVLDPPGEPEPLGYAALAPADNYMMRHRLGIIMGTAIAVVGGLPLLYWLSFDFNPIDLQNPDAEATATYLELSRDASTDANAIQVLAPSLDQADAIAGRMAKLPDVSHAMTLARFIPELQSEKLPIIRNAAEKLAAAFDPRNAQPPPSDAENLDALNEGADRLLEAADDRQGPGAGAAKRLASALSSLAKASPSTRASAAEAFLWPLGVDLAALQSALQAQAVTRASLPPELVGGWVAADGRARVSIAPKGDPGDNEAMRRFARAVLAVEPDATEGPISILEAGDLVVHAFVEAGALALLSIAILLWLVLRRVSDVLLTLIPLALAGVVTLEVCVAIGLRLNFANIIALPLLLGVGVAFKIYYIMAWREGQTHLLQTSLTRAVIYSALTTATAFGSLCFSSHPGTASMGKLLVLSLLCTLAAAVLFQPILMGKPRGAAAGAEAEPFPPLTQRGPVP